MQTLQEIAAVYLGEKNRTRRDAWAVHRIRVTESTDPRFAAGKEYECSGESDPIEIGDESTETKDAELRSGCEYHFYGKIVEREFRGVVAPQLQFQTFVRCVPHSKEAVIRYLQEAPHVGPRVALLLWDKFAADAVRILRETPEVAAAASAKKLSEPHAIEAAKYLVTLAAMEAVTMDMMDLLGGYGFPKATGRAAIREWGNTAPAIIRRNPYMLMRFRGCGFLKTDKMYLSLGLPAAKIKRQALCCWHSLASDSEGHTWQPVGTMIRGLEASIGGVKVEPEKAIALARRARMIETRRTYATQGVPVGCCDGWNIWAADGKRARAERKVAELVVSAMDEPSPWSAVFADGGKADSCLAPLTPHQREQLSAALRGTISILGGSPGTGKTFTAAALMKLIVAACGVGSVAIAAPTGKAAVRCSEAMAGYGLPLKAKTIHSLLRVSAADDGTGEWSFEHNAENPLPFRFLIADETSMADVPLMASLLSARSRGTAVLFIGDVNQLPPVGHGAPLRDFIAAGLPYGELTEIKRNAGTIVRACAAIRDGGMFVPNSPAEMSLDVEPPRNLVHLPTPTPEGSIGSILKLLREIREAGKFNPVWDVQVVVAVNKKSPLSREALNKLLQAELNPAGQGVDGSPFRVGDKVIATKNSFFRLADESNDDKPDRDAPEVFVANGEFGKVVRVESNRTVVVFPSGDAPRRVVVSRGKQEGNGEGDSESDAGGTGCNLELGYAATCHKMQGSQAPVVIVVLDEYPGASGRHGVAKREWLYTAISRAEKLCYLVGKLSVAQRMIRERALPFRKTFLADDISGGLMWGEVPATNEAEFSTCG